MTRYVLCKPDKPKLTYWSIIATAYLGLTA